MKVKATNSVLNLVDPPIDEMVLLSGTIDNVVIGSNVPNVAHFTALFDTALTAPLVGAPASLLSEVFLGYGLAIAGNILYLDVPRPPPPVNLPDMRARVAAGYDASNASGRLTDSPSGGVSASALGNAGGSQGHNLTAAEQATMPVQWSSGGQPLTNAGSGVEAAAGSGVGLDSTGQAIGGGGAHNNVQPTLIVGWLIKY